MKLPSFNIATVVFAVGLVVASTLVTILLRNPATHLNLEDPQFYDRTEMAFVDQEYLYVAYGFGPGLLEAGADPHLLGRMLYVRSGCIGCHGVFAQGGTVGSTLWDISDEDLGDFIRDVRDGPGEMPAYPESILSDDDLRLIHLYLESGRADAAAAGVTAVATTTTTTPPVISTTTVADPETTTSTTPGPVELALDAPMTEAIVVDGNTSDWDDIPGLDLILEPIEGKDAPPHQASIKVAHDDSFLYVLFAVEDDFNWSDVDPHFSGAPAIMWPIEPAAGPHMGGEDPSGLPALGMVDIWYWRLDCPIGVEQGGSVSGPGTGDPGNDDACNFDDEWAIDPETVEDDVGPGAENSLLGVFSHTNPVEDTPGTWFFEMRRPLQTGDPMDAQFTVGESVRLALAYWDPDAGQNGWGRQDHVQSSNHGWINVLLTS